MRHPTEEQILKVRERVNEKPSIPISLLADDLGLSTAAVVEALPENMRVGAPISDFEEIWQAMCDWEKVTFIVTNNGAIVEAGGRLPQGKFGQGFFNLDSATGMVGGHLKISALGRIWLVSKPFFSLESHSVQFFDTVGDPMFSIYVGRGADRKLIPEVVEAFQNLKAKHAVNVPAK